MADTIRIRRMGGGPDEDTYSAPYGTPIPDGFEVVSGEASKTTSSEGLGGTLYDMLRSFDTGYRNYVAKPATEGIARGLKTLPFAQDPGTQSAIDTGSKYLFPQTPIGAGMTIGSIASAGLPLASRLIGATAGGFIGGGLEGTPNTGAGEGLIGGLTGEALAYPFSAAGRGLLQQGMDERAVGRAIGEISPTLGAPTTAAEMQARLKGVSGKNDLSSTYATARDTVEQGTLGQPGAGALQAGFPAPLSSNNIQVPAGGALEQLTGKSAMTFDEAASAIEALRAGRHPLTGALSPSQKGATEQALKGQAVRELAHALGQMDPALADLFTSAEANYGKGMELIRLFRQKGVLDPQTGGLNMPKLQALAGERGPALERMLGPDGWQALQDAVYRGSVPPGMDLPGFQLPLIGAYPGSFSVRESLPLTPTRYIGNPLRMPSAPFMPPVTQTIDPYLNPYRKR